MTAYFDFAETIYRRQSHAGVRSIVQNEIKGKKAVHSELLFLHFISLKMVDQVFNKNVSNSLAVWHK